MVRVATISALCSVAETTKISATSIKVNSKKKNGNPTRANSSAVAPFASPLNERIRARRRLTVLPNFALWRDLLVQRENQSQKHIRWSVIILG
jgi:hypothetical protein